MKFVKDNINRYYFDFTGYPLILETIDPIKLSLKKKLDKYISFVVSDLVHTVANSSAKRFNDANKNTLVLLSKEFIEFLNLNLIVSKEAKKFFDPFEGVNDLNDDEELFVVDDEGNGVLKKINFKLNSKLLFSAFVLDKVLKLFKEEGLKNYAINKNTLFFSSFNEYDEIEYEIDEGVLFKDHLKNEGLSIIFNENMKKKLNSRAKFGSIDNKIKPKFFVIYGDSFVDNMMYYSLLKNFERENEFSTFAINNDLTFKVIGKDNKTALFSPGEHAYDY